MNGSTSITTTFYKTIDDGMSATAQTQLDLLASMLGEERPECLAARERDTRRGARVVSRYGRPARRLIRPAAIARLATGREPTDHRPDHPHRSRSSHPHHQP